MWNEKRDIGGVYLRQTSWVQIDVNSTKNNNTNYNQMLLKCYNSRRIYFTSWIKLDGFVTLNFLSQATQREIL